MQNSKPESSPSTQLSKTVLGAAHEILLLLALLLGPGPAFAQVPSATLLTTITNPTPTFGGIFGSAVAAMGNDRVLIGSGAGAAYLLNTSGTLLTTFTISDPAAGDFGDTLAAVGSDRVLIGSLSYGTAGASPGRAYLFRTNGTLQTTFTNPSPARVEVFGWAVAAFGSDRVLISGLANLNLGAPYLGAGYLFGTNGTLLATFTNPTPAIANEFGVSLAAVGSDRVIMGATSANTGATRAGVAYLFSTNGTLLTTITNPVPVVGDNFGYSVAAVGSDRVLISAIDYGNVGTGGAAYLFSTNGTLITTFTNPTPETYDNFGYSVAAVGTTRVLIGAYQDSPDVFRSGSAYLFSANGTLLNTFTNPTPAADDNFGVSVAAVGSDRVIIGAHRDDTGGLDSGAAYLFDLPYPPLSISQNAGTASVKWVTPETGIGLQQASVLGSPTAWSNTSDSVSINGLTNVVQKTIANGTTNRFFRLRRP